MADMVWNKNLSLIFIGGLNREDKLERKMFC
jgi:hypothetical protein